MNFDKPIVTGTLIKRYKRFFADVELDEGETVTAHCPNTGSMKTCGGPGDKVVLTKNDDPKRKLKYTWELTQFGKTFVGVNTAMPNKIVGEALFDKKIAELADYSEIKPEVKYGEKSRIDFLLTGEGLPDCYVEVKNATLAEGELALFPDAVTSRGLKHLHELTKVVQQGQRAAMLYLVNRGDVTSFTPAWDIDPAYCEGLIEAVEAGVEVLVYQTKASKKGICVDKALPYELKPRN